MTDDENYFLEQRLSFDKRRRTVDACFPAFDEGFYKRLIDNLYDAVYFVNRERRITYWNKAAEQLTGYAADQVVGHCCADNLLVHTDCDGNQLCRDHCPLSLSLADGGAREAEVYLRHKKGHRVPVSVRVTPIYDRQQRIVGAVEVFSDNSTKKVAEQRTAQLEKMAFLDALTSIPNRHFLELRLSEILEEVRRYDHRFGFMLIDVDRFKEINDRYGHSVGDATLIVIAQTLARSLRAADIVGRWGGDEFLAVVSEVELYALERLAERCRTLLSQSRVPHPNGDLQLSVSIGGSLITSEDSLGSILHRADQRLYESKKQGRNCATIG